MLGNTALNPETLSMLKTVLRLAQGDLPIDQQTQERKTLMASHLLALASRGERDPLRLRAALAGGE
jgi:hypothetical protein